jgi:subtilisin family serine protease
MKLPFKQFFCCIASLYFWVGTTVPTYAQGGQENDLAWIVMLRPSVQNWQENYRHNAAISAVKLLSKSLAIYQVKSRRNIDLYPILSKDSAVLFLQKDADVSWRSQPNDPLFPTQWALDSIDIETAWQYTRGGLSQDGDSIVCAIIDGSFDVEHEDLMNNIWHNHAEIPNNLIDDDLNGWVDDYTGWQLVYGNDQHNYGNLSNHGTSILGIIAAQGNNNIGVCGLNQQLKLLLLSAHTGAEITKLSTIIEGFSYVYEMRKKYNESAGQSGAFVVAVNGSWGINRGQAADHPIWCALYDSLGKVGVLSIAATTNSDESIDIFGDMPCSCPSSYLLSVGESTRTDAKDGGYGQIHLDLFAPAATKTTRWFNNYGDFGGTSGAAPHVSAAVALLYSYKHTAWIALCKQNPAKAALLIKQILLNSVDIKPPFEQSVAKGRLNVGKAMQQLAEYFTVPEKEQILGFYPNPANDKITLKIALQEVGGHDIQLYSLDGRLIKTWRLETGAPSISYRSIDLSGVAKGYYVLYFRGNNGLQSLKLIKQ